MRAARLVLLLALCYPAFAQAQGVELTVYGGYNLGGSIDFSEQTNPKLDTVDSFATGLSLTWQRNPAQAFELMWLWRPTDIEWRANRPQGAPTTLSLNAHDFQGNFLFMPAYRESNLTPFLLFGLGATYLDPGEVGAISPDGATKFSWALGAGVKTTMHERFGFRAQVRYHSTYVNDEYSGTWCDPYYGCYNTVDSNWLDEWDFMGGIILNMGSRK